MYCPKCGKAVKDGYEFCMGCGAKIEGVSNDVAVTDAHEVEMTASNVSLTKKPLNKKLIGIAGIGLVIVLLAGLFVQQFISTAKYNEIYDDMVVLMYIESYEIVQLAVGRLKYAVEGDRMIAGELFDLLDQQKRVVASRDVLNEQIEVLRNAPIIFKKDFELFNEMYTAYMRRSDLDGSAWSAATGHDGIAEIMDRIVAERPQINKSEIDNATIRDLVPRATALLEKYGHPVESWRN
jgi:hypothetical protein